MFAEDLQYKCFQFFTAGLDRLWNIRRRFTVEVVQNHAGEELGFMSALSNQQVDHLCLLWIGSVELDGETAPVLLVCHIDHLPEWENR